jgi:ATP-dependent Lhr-like helicase
VLPGTAGRWRLLSGPGAGFAPESLRARARARQWLERYGVVCRETLAGEAFSLEQALPWLEQLESEGEAERDGLPDMDTPHFLATGADKVWRQAAEATEASGRVLAACDPANPFGLFIPWPAMAAGHHPQRSPGARVLLAGGALAGYMTRTGRALYTPRHRAADPGREWIALLKAMAAAGPVFLESVDGEPAYQTRWHGDLVAAGFSPSRRGYLLRAGR